MSGIDRQRRQHREDLGHEPFFEPDEIVGFEFGRLNDGHAGLGELAAQRDPGHLLIGHQPAGPPADGIELLGRRQSVLARRLDPGQQLASEPGNPHHVEFVEIVCRDRQEAQPLEQRVAAVLGFGEHPFVEGEPRKLAIDEPLLQAGLDRLRLGRRGAGGHFRPSDLPDGGARRRS